MRRTLTAIVVTGVALALSVGPARPAAADSSTVTVPEHAAGPALTLLGASERGVLVRQAAISAGGRVRFFSGAEGTRLVRRTPLEYTVNSLSPVSVLGVSGNSIAYYRIGLPGACNCAWKAVGRMDVRSGAQQFDGLMPPPLALSGSSWFSDAIGSYSDYPFPPPALKRYTASSASFLSSTNIAATTGNSVALAVDGNTGLLASFGFSDPDDSGSPPVYHLDLIDLTTGAKTPVVASTPAEITRVAISADRIAWDSKAGGQTLRINQRARTGGATMSYPEPAGIVADTKLVLARGKVGYLAPVSGGSVLRVLDGTSARTVPLPAGSSGLGSAGDHFVTAAGGAAGVAGVYAVTPTGNPTRVATLPQATYGLSNVTLSGSRLHYTDASRTDRPGRPVWMRTVSGNSRPSLGAETLMPQRAGDLTSFSGGRAAISAPGTDAVRLFDRDSPTGAVAVAVLQGTSLNVSGPYLLAGGSVFRPDGERLYSTSATEPEYTTASDDLFGSTIVFATYDEDSRKTRIWVDDVEKPHRVLLATLPDCGDVQVSVWGGTVAWVNCDGRTLTVRNLTTGATRAVPAAAAGDGVNFRSLALGEGVLAWTTNGGVNVLDLTSPSSHAVLMPGPGRAFALDDHRIALMTDTRYGVGDPVRVAQLPLGNLTYRPRLIASYALGAFTPDGDGRSDTWTPQFDVTKPVRSVELSITDPAGRTVRDLEAPDSPDGGIRGLVWDGRDRKGKAAPVGVYTWTLTARAEDGDGRLTGPRGEATVTGTIEVDAVS